MAAMAPMSPNDQGVSKIIADMTPEERDKTLRDLLHQAQNAQGDDSRKIEDANLLLRLRPKVLVTTYIPMTRRYAQRLQDRKVWDQGIIDPLADEDIPGRPQIIKVETSPDGLVLFERDSVLGMPGTAEPVHVQVPPAHKRRMVKPTSADLDEGSHPQPLTQVLGGTPDDFEDGPEVDAGPTTVPVDPEVLTQMLARLEGLEEENARLRAGQAPAPEPISAPAKAANKRRQKVKDGPEDKPEVKAPEEVDQPETVGSK